MFLEKSRKKHFNYEVQLWKREIGAIWLPYEKRKIEQFSRVKANERINLDGYVKWVDNNVFALVPTTFSNQIKIVCVNETDTKPAENAHVAITGTARWHGFRKAVGDLELSRSYSADLIVYVDDVKNQPKEIDLPKTTFDYDDFKRDIDSCIGGLEPQVVDSLAFTAISTPMFYKKIGGLNLTLYDSTKTGLPKIVVRKLSQFLPTDLGDFCSIGTPFGKFQMRYKYGFFSEDADGYLSKFANNLLSDRAVSNIKEYDEASLSLFSKRDKPSNIDDPPFRLSDIATTVSEGLEINTNHFFEPDSFKYWLASQLVTPNIRNYDHALLNIQKQLEKLRESWGLPASELAKYGILDANYNAKPESIVRQCLAYARAHHNIDVDTSAILQIFEKYFKWNFENSYDIYEDFLASHKIDLMSLRIKYRDIIRIMRKHEASGEIGVAKEVILREAKTSRSETQDLLKDCLNRGIIYEPRKGFYRQTQD